MDQASKDEVERRLENWARWKRGGMSDGRFTQFGGGSSGVSSVYRQGPRSRRSGYAVATFPVLASEAQATNRAINALDDDLRAVVYARYLRQTIDGRTFTVDWTQEEIGADLGCTRRTVLNRLARALDCIRLHLWAPSRAG